MQPVNTEYKGWTITYCALCPRTAQWIASKGAISTHAASRDALIAIIDAKECQW
jgi:hypothetical protein